MDKNIESVIEKVLDESINFSDFCMYKIKEFRVDTVEGSKAYGWLHLCVDGYELVFYVEVDLDKETVGVDNDTGIYCDVVEKRGVFIATLIDELVNSIKRNIKC